MAADAEKAERTKAKRSVTRQINHVKQLMAEEETEACGAEIGKLKEIFKTFIEANDKYESVITGDDDLEQSEVYFAAVQKEYIETLKQAKKLRDEATVKDEDKDETGKRGSASGSADLSREELVGIMNLPKLVIDTFNGDPLKYHTFVAVFEQNVGSIKSDGDAKLTRLLQYTSGPAKEAITKCALIGGDDGYNKARDILHKRFGDKHLVTEKIMSDVRKGRPLKTPDELQRFSDDLGNSYEVLKKMGRLPELDTQLAIVDMVERLLPFIRNRWKKQAMDMKREKGTYPDLKLFVEFVNNMAVELNDPVYGNVNKPGEKDKKHRNMLSYHANAGQDNNMNQGMSPAGGRPVFKRRQEPPCILCNERHRLWYCKQFKDMKPKDRLGLVRSNKLCENCLIYNHSAVDCRKQSVCSVPGCGEKHTKFLHIVPDKPQAGNVVSNSNTNIDGCAKVFMPVVPVRVNNDYYTHALLDTASSGSFCTESLVNKLGLKYESVTYNLSTLSERNDKRQTKRVDLKLSAQDGVDEICMSNVYVVDSIPVETPVVDVNLHPHLKGIPLVQGKVQVEILIGQDNSEALLPLQVKRGEVGQPFAIRTLFGWCLNGASADVANKKISSYFITTLPPAGDTDIKRVFDLECGDVVSDKTGFSIEDEKVIQLWDAKCKVVDGHYELPIPWREGKELPNNLEMAIPRLNGLKSKLNRTGLYEKYDDEVKKLLGKGYAEQVPEKQVYGCDKAWYLPHHPVVTDKKPGKVRLVFDCAARYRGESLNDKAYQGPDLNNKLLHVLLRFRQEPFAIMGDVEAMYSQVKVPEYDRDALRFIWYNENGAICHYRMTSHLFGGVWCASAATYALRRTTMDHDVPPIIKDTILSSFYVDDCLKSAKSKEEAEQIVTETKDVLAKKGFHLTKFVSNDDELLFDLPEDDVSKEVKLIDNDSASKVLGIKWNTKSDHLFFEVEKMETAPITRRKMLSYVSSMYDPLGLIGPVAVKGKMILQEATRLGLSWDDEIPRKLAVEWETWTNTLREVDSIRIPRCVKPAQYDDTILELHHFSDSSEKAFGCCTYLRCVGKDGHIHIALLISKCRVTPIRALSIPRLELQAAVLATQIDDMLRREINLELYKSTFWVDSEIVLGYVKNESKRFHVFVANRISIIRRHTLPEQWRHVSGLDNPSDIISRGCTPDELCSNGWFTGPDFLRKHRSEWDIRDTDVSISEDDPEVKKCHVTSHANTKEEGQICHPLERLCKHYSDWHKLKRAIAWILKVKDMLRGKRQHEKARLEVKDLDRAEMEIIKHAQTGLRQEVNIGAVKSHNLRQLDPYLDQDGVVKVGGRTSKAGVNYKNQIIIPYGPVTTLLVRYFHEMTHMGREYTLAQLRERYWVRRKDVKKILHKCVTCRRMNGRPHQQKMGNLPETRLSVNEVPFTHTGTDCFGPFMIKRARSEIKRYGCIFTCMNTRAIHIEVLESLDTDSFVNALRRFIARRNQPKTITSDNGGNFVSANKELAKGLKELDQDQIYDALTRKGIEWKFIPPHSSNMGGAWERQIRSVRKVLMGLLGEQRLTEETLSTLMCEVEGILNNRPITAVSDDINDLQALRPSHLLLLKECPVLPPCLADSRDIYKRRWRQVQYLAQVFWRRFIKEYMPELQRRQKWLQKRPNVSVGDIMLVIEENIPRNLWPLCRVIQVTPGTDGIVRSVKIKTRNAVLTRPVSKLVMLEGKVY